LLVGGEAKEHRAYAGEEKQVLTDSQTQRVFLALADPTRRLLLQYLCEEGSGTAAGFATRLPITRQAIIKHLVVLEQAGLVTAHEMGRERRYVPRPEALQTATTWIGEISAQWDQRLAALRSYLLDEPHTPSTLEEEHAKHGITEEKDE
jgi:DNA-binding transcriptional ArsR family regulator